MNNAKLVYKEAELTVLQFFTQDIISTSTPYEDGGDMGDWTPPRE